MSVRLRMNQAIGRAIADEMRDDPSVVLWGEDVADAGGVFKVSDGLVDEFGSVRVRDTPISEGGFLGAAVGAAASGLRPIVEIMFIEFLGVALDQLVTEAALFRYLSGGAYPVPLTVRASAGGGLGFGSQHSGMLERWLVGTPGLSVVVASGARTGYGLTRAAIRSNDPVVVLEPRRLYAEREVFEPGPESILALGVAETVQAGTDLTIIGLGGTVPVINSAVAGADWSAEVIDLLTISPWDRQTVLASVARTGRVVIVEESPATGGWGADIAAVIASEVFTSLQAPIVRVTTPDVPVPFAPALEDRFIPTPDEVTRQVETLLSTGAPLEPWWIREGVAS
jgi:pyruvate/2-oxoglutarate/acetoin dehydrogenase E1 component